MQSDFKDKQFKTILMIVASLLIISGLITLVIYLTKPKTKDLTKNTKVSQVMEQQVLFPSLSTNKQKIFFFSSSKELAFYSANIDGSNITKTSGTLDTPNYVIWSPDHQKAILQAVYNQYVFEKYSSPFASPGTPDQTLTSWIYNFQTQKLNQLDNHITNLAWLNNDKILYQYLDQGKNMSSLYMANPDGSKAEKITDLPENLSYELSPINNDKILVTSSPSDTSPSKLYILTLSDKKLNPQTQIQLTSKAIALSENNILYSVTKNDKANNLSISDLLTNKSDGLNVQTIMDNVLALPDNKFLCIDFSSGSNIISKYDLSKKQLTKITKISQDNPTNIMSISDKIIYFTSDGLLYKVEVN